MLRTHSYSQNLQVNHKQIHTNRLYIAKDKGKVKGKGKVHPMTRLCGHRGKAQL